MFYWFKGLKAPDWLKSLKEQKVQRDIQVCNRQRAFRSPSRTPSGPFFFCRAPLARWLFLQDFFIIVVATGTEKSCDYDLLNPFDDAIGI